MDTIFSKDALVHAVAGTCGGSLTMTTFYPLEIIRTYIQIDPKYKGMSTAEAIRTMLQNEGVSVLYKGLKNTLITLGCSNFVYFYTNEGLKVLAQKITESDRRKVTLNDTALNLLIATAAGVLNVLTTCPLWVVNTRLKIQKKGTDEIQMDGMIDGILKIINKEGWKSMWSGCVPSLILVSNPTIQYVLYDMLKRILISYRKKRNLSALEYFLLGALCKVTSTMMTYPLQLAQSRLRNSGHNVQEGKREQFNNTITCLTYIYRTDGFLGWYQGLNVKLVQTVLMSAFHFVFYEKIMHVIYAILRPKSK
ncbi:peroxisomal adenine nucleotide transporter [Acrasis kona]|uniref:Peroxisomal adenine nucleotide transporter n=1 Tax=Acrasis kona TaxID=1008807 RepID=A0AAW2Z2U4_9EUKA